MGLQIATEGIPNLVAAGGCLRPRLDETQECFLHRIIDAQSAEGEPARLPCRAGAPSRIAPNVVLGARVAYRELVAAAPATDKPGERRFSMHRRLVMPARRHDVAHHLRIASASVRLHAPAVGLIVGLLTTLDMKHCTVRAIMLSRMAFWIGTTFASLITNTLRHEPRRSSSMNNIRQSLPRDQCRRTDLRLQSEWPSL